MTFRISLPATFQEVRHLSHHLSREFSICKKISHLDVQSVAGHFWKAWQQNYLHEFERRATTEKVHFQEVNSTGIISFVKKCKVPYE